MRIEINCLICRMQRQLYQSRQLSPFLVKFKEKREREGERGTEWERVNAVYWLINHVGQCNWISVYFNCKCFHIKPFSLAVKDSRLTLPFHLPLQLPFSLSLLTFDILQLWQIKIFDLVSPLFQLFVMSCLPDNLSKTVARLYTIRKDGSNMPASLLFNLSII